MESLLFQFPLCRTFSDGLRSSENFSLIEFGQFQPSSLEYSLERKVEIIYHLLLFAFVPGVLVLTLQVAYVLLKAASCLTLV